MESMRRKVLVRMPTPQTKGGKQLLEKLLRKEDTSLDDALQELPRTRFVHRILTSLIPNSDQWEEDDREDAVNILRNLKDVKQNKDELWEALICGNIQMNGSESVLEQFEKLGFKTSAAAWSTSPENIALQVRPAEGEAKVPRYTAFSGASGSGKTSTMLWALRHVVLKSLPPEKWCLKYYISCKPSDSESLDLYVTNHIRKTLNNVFQFQFHTMDDFREQCQKTCLVLLLDEVQSRFDHESFYELPAVLKQAFHFEKVVLLVGSTAISQNVCRQPTTKREVLYIRMKPLDEKAMQPLLSHHLKRMKPEIGRNLGTIVKNIFDQMPVLWDLMSNHRCAYLSAVVLSELLGKTLTNELPEGWGQGHSNTLVAMVACKYRGLSGLQNKSSTECRSLMLESLALLAGQRRVPKKEGVDKVPKESSLASLAKVVIEIGLVERAILPDEEVQDTNKVKVDGDYEFQMSPALTLICVTAILPSIEGILNVADHFEALVATLMVAMRYAQTNQVFPIRQLKLAVPYSGNEDYKFYHPESSLDRCCFINGPQAPYSNLIVAGVPKGLQFPSTASRLARAISSQKGVVEFPVHPLLVQCKYTSKETAQCSFASECAKMGFHMEKQSDGCYCISSPSENPFLEGSKDHKKYPPGQWLTNFWVKNGDDTEQVGIAFATNTRFDGDLLDGGVKFMEAERCCDYAWQKLYPIVHLVRDETKYHSIGRKKGVL